MASTPDKAKLAKIADSDHALGAGEPFVPHTCAQSVFMTLEDPTFNKPAKYISNFIMSLIVLGCITYVMESMEMFQTLNPDCTKKDLTPYPAIKDDLTAAVTAPDGACVPKPLGFFYQLETICILIFTVEYICRILTVHTVPEHVWNIQEEALEEADPDDGAVHVAHEKSALGLTYGYATSFMNCIDIVAIVPFYIEYLFKAGGGLGVIRVMRLTRVLRVLKSPKFAEAVKLFSLSLSASWPALSILFFFSLLGIILMGSLTFFFEQGKYHVKDEVCCPDYILGGVVADAVNGTVVHMCQLGCFVRPDYLGMGHEVSPFTSIPTSFYWVIVTMTTVGYGDLLPTTSMGRIISMLVMYGGIFGLALPITVIGANFSRQYELLNQERERKRKEMESLQRSGAADAAAHALLRARATMVAAAAPAVAPAPASEGALSIVSKTEVSVRPGPSSVRYEIADVTEEDEAAALAGELKNDMKSILVALPRIEGAVSANCADAQKLQALLQRLRNTVAQIQKC